MKNKNVKMIYLNVP